ncbi:MAG TPA: hypothetical protein VIJ34_15735 [Acidimicrobiales bacterium]
MNRISTIGGSGTSEYRNSRRSFRQASIQSNNVISEADRAVLPHSRMGLFQATLVAILSLVLVGAVAFGSMVGSAELLHLLSPAKQFDAFRALHEPAVVEVLLGLAILWLLPPHPWAMSGHAVASRRHLSRSKAKA